MTPAFAEFSPIAESGIKVALTTGMTTDRKIFQSHKFCAIMVQNQISGYSAVGSALALGHSRTLLNPFFESAAKPCGTRVCGFLFF